MLVVEQKELDRHLFGTIQELREKTSAKRNKWNSICWVLLNSMLPPVGRFVEGLSETAEMWKPLSIQYSSKGNDMLTNQIDGKIHHLRQGDMLVTA